MIQIALPLQHEGESDGYLVSPANEWVHQQLQSWQLWPSRTAILIGAEASGKSAMAAQFAKDSHGLIQDEAELMDDQSLFHQWNIAHETGQPLLLVSRQPVAQWGVELADLRSRLAASHLLEIPPPDQILIEALLQKYFITRGLSINDDIIAFLGKRMERSYAFVQNLARVMDRLASERKKPLSMAIARDAIMFLQHEDVSDPSQLRPPGADDVGA